jgi:hypothetical protein
MSRVNPYFSTEFYLFYLAHTKSQVFMKQLGSRIGHTEVHATYSFEFFVNSKYI